jgi:hypothetical protein
MTTPTPSTDPLEQAFRRLRDAADADEYVPTEQVIDTVLTRLAAARAEPSAFRRLRSCLEFDERAPIEVVIEAALQRFDYDLHLVGENARLRVACTLALRIMEQKNKVNVPPLAKFIEVTFDPEDMAVLRAALEKKP